MHLRMIYLLMFYAFASEPKDFFATALARDRQTFSHLKVEPETPSHRAEAAEKNKSTPIKSNYDAFRFSHNTDVIRWYSVEFSVRRKKVVCEGSLRQRVGMKENQAHVTLTQCQGADLNMNIDDLLVTH